MIYRTEREKFMAMADEIERMHSWDVLPLDGRASQLVGHDPQGTRRRRRVPACESSKHARRSRRTRSRRSSARGRPILVGTVSIEKSERLSALLEKRGVKHQVLNAKHHKREAEIVAQAGR